MGTIYRSVEEVATETDPNKLHALANDLSDKADDHHPLLIAIAKNPHTAPMTLAYIKDMSESEEIQLAVAGNVNAPWSALEALKRDSKYESVKRQVWDTFAAQRTLRHQLSILTKRDEEQAGDLVFDELGWSLFLDDDPTPWTPEQQDLIDRAQEVEDPEEIHQIFLSAYGTFVVESEVYFHIACNPHTAPMTLSHIASLAITAGEVDVLHSVAVHKNTPEPTIRMLAQSDASPVREAVAKNPNTPPDVIASVVGVLRPEDGRREIPATSININAAQNPNTPLDIITAYLERGSDELRWNLAKNPNTALIENVLHADTHSEVRNQLAKNPSVSPQVLSALARDKNWLVRQSVAENPSTPTDDVLFLTLDENKRVRDTATASSRAS